MLTREFWRPVHWLEGYHVYKGYEVSDLGRVRRDGRILTPWEDCRGTLRVSLCSNGIYKSKPLVRRLVALAFVPKEENQIYVIHKDRDRWNCEAKNLQWVTREELVKLMKEGHLGNERYTPFTISR